MRNLIKWQLINERGLYSELSGKPIKDNDLVDMHEVFVPRAVVSGWDEIRKQSIFHPYNMVLLKRSEHELATSKVNKAILAKKLIARYGKDNIQNWLDGLGLKYRMDLSQWD